MTSKVIRLKQTDMFPEIKPERKPYKKITTEEFEEFVKDSFACCFAFLNQLKTFNEFLTLHQLELQDKIISHEEEIIKLKNP